jgi:hypothetical protein
MDSHEEIPPVPGKENKAIHGILVKILDKWRTAARVETEEAFKETVIISPETLKEETPSLPRNQETEEILQKTVIFTPRGTSGREEPPPVHKPEEISETVILSPKGLGRETQAPIAESGPTGGKGIQPAHDPEEISEKDQFLQETIILKPGKVRDKANR